MNKIKIMIVEDEVITGMALRIGLSELGYEICELANSGKEAIRIAEKEKPNIVLMDINLHGKIDGIEAAIQIKSRFGIPIAFLTGYPDEEMMKKAKAAEPIGYFVKPVECSELKVAFDKALREIKPLKKK